ncbi:TolC family protein [Sulfuricurvum sp.]|uniref:TolC family protein n=1 Tax=Sulfuricurvum sp. TaxID=2025608 RepID=UPI002626FED0|nr:TolC family protein [Sulfuricurvum sp.]MDD2780715.1 TolC family protein [Sulfuricurvum sp.]
MKKRYIATLPLLLMTNLCGSDNALLSGEKQELLRQQKEIYEFEHEKLRTNWIAPLNLNASYSYDKSAQGDYHSDTENLSASISQDIFRSGGIMYQIAYADAKKQSESIAYQQQIAALNQQLFLALLTYQKNSVLLEQSQKRLDNKEIEIFIKRQLYDAGKVDITELNNAFMGKSNELKTLISLKYALSEQRFEIAKISDITPDTFPIPRFEMIAKEQYLSGQFDLQYAQAQSDTLKNLSEVTATNYLPSIALNADVGYRNYDPKELSGAYNGNYYSAGFQLTMPLVYNASATIQEAQATYLKEAAKTADKKRELNAQYAQVLEKIQSYRDTISITSKNLLLYDELIRVLQAGVNAGTKTGYDLQTLKNTKTIEELEIKINEINIQIEFAKLHFALHPSKENL